MKHYEVIYLPHPVSWEEKQKHQKAGKRIIDARFAPAGYWTEPVEPEFVPPIAETIAQPENVVIEEQAAPKRRGRRKKVVEA